MRGVRLCSKRSAPESSQTAQCAVYTTKKIVVVYYTRFVLNTSPKTTAKTPWLPPMKMVHIAQTMPILVSQIEKATVDVS